MASTSAPAPAPASAPPAPRRRHPTTTARVGYSIAIVLNAIMLWMAHQLLRWEWPAFLTEEFDRLLPIVTASFLASIAVNGALLIRDASRFRGLTDLVTAAFGLAVSLRTWTVFPFDFSGYGNDWTWLARTVVVVGIVGTSIGIGVAVVKMVRPAAAGDA